MTRRERRELLSSLQLLLEYAKDELEAVRLNAAATLVDNAMILIDRELTWPKSNASPSSSAVVVPFGKPRLVVHRRAADETIGRS
jgi:hypothetical protein